MQSVKELFEMYLARTHLAHNSIAIRGRAIDHFVNCCGDMAITEIGYNQAEDYRNWLANGRAATTVNIYLKNIRPIFTWAQKRGLIKNNPFEGLAEMPHSRQRAKVYSPAELERILTVADNRWKAIILLGLCSMRRGEVLNLTVSEIFFDKNYVLLQEKKNTETTWFWKPKNGSQQIVPIPERLSIGELEINLHHLLIELIERLPGRQPYLMIPERYYQNMLRRRAEGKLDWRHEHTPWGNFTRDFRKVLKKAAVPYRRFHDLRATFATTASEHGVAMVDLQRMMRHRSMNTTAIYVRSEDKRLVDISTKVAANYYRT